MPEFNAAFSDFFFSVSLAFLPSEATYPMSGALASALGRASDAAST